MVIQDPPTRQRSLLTFVEGCDGAQGPNPRPLGFVALHLGGMDENSPAPKAFGAGIAPIHVRVPEGRPNQPLFRRPYGTHPQQHPPPALKRWAIFACPYGTGAQDGLFKS